MNEIKVSVSYEKPSTNKFDALMKEYETAKKVADETVTYYKPLADAAEEAKFSAIMCQLKTIQRYAKQISEIKNETVWISYWAGACRFDVVYRPKETEYRYEVTWGGTSFTKDNMNIIRPLIGQWEERRVYKGLEEEAFKQLKEEIEKQVKRGQAQIDRLNNIVKEEF